MNHMIKTGAILVLAIVAISFSGCCCCYGVDGFTSKYQKSANDIQFPAQITADGKQLTLTKSEYYSTPDACKSAISKALVDEGLTGKVSEGDLGNALGIAGGNEAKMFEYSDASGKRVGGVVGKGDSPGKLSASFIAGKQILGGDSGFKFVDSFKAGDESYVYSTNEYRQQPAYVAVSRYSNMFVYACSYDSAASAEDAVASAINAIDAANK